jgi:hypothetical protein
MTKPGIIEGGRNNSHTTGGGLGEQRVGRALLTGTHDIQVCTDWQIVAGHSQKDSLATGKPRVG